jgi:hypothetical protein
MIFLVYSFDDFLRRRQGVILSAITYLDIFGAMSLDIPGKFDGQPHCHLHRMGPNAIFNYECGSTVCVTLAIGQIR